MTGGDYTIPPDENGLDWRLSLSSLKTTVRKASTSLFMCALVRDSDWPTWLIRGHAVSAARLRSITKSRFTAVVRAYDDEGYIYLELA